MVPGKDTNTVYLSELLHKDSRFAYCCNQLTAILDRHGILYKFIKATKHIWCRDYMPIQIENKDFVQFRYEPSYLKDYLHLQSDPKIVSQANRLNPEFTNINLDGGNIVNWSDRAIITDRVFDENPEFTSKAKLIFEIEQLLGVELIVIPQIKSDMTGHVDGLVRFVDRSTILGSHREQEYKYWKNGINKVLEEQGIEYIDIPSFEYKDRKYKDNAIGCYINFLEVKNLIVLPIFEIDGNRDNEVLSLFKQIYPDRIIETINFNEIGLFGGLLNCTTWTTKE